MQSIYLETSVIGYLATRTSSDLVTAGNQTLTRDWWENHRCDFELFISEAVIAECGAGDPSAANERAVFLTGLSILEITDECKKLAAEIMKQASLPKKADVDALHIAVAALNGIDYLLTWNCKHIANPALRRIIESVLSQANIIPPVICTPQEIINV
ncbi:MAG: type II toxin-antitoxin system VapC family toxin [Pirellulales bacterium]|nr:type II toxin-antitoxin system VapC family toxin [Pirellulales bacterium]